MGTKHISSDEMASILFDQEDAPKKDISIEDLAAYTLGLLRDSKPLIDLGFMDEHGNITEAGEHWLQSSFK